MKEYHKIETVYNRLTNGTKKLDETSFRDKTVEFLKNLPWQFTEKIDGTNIRINWDGHRVSFGGRTDRAQIPVDLMNWLTSHFCDDATEELFEQKFGENDVTLYGEGYGKKIQGVGSLYRNDVSFILFDVMINDNYQPRSSVEDIASAFGIDVVPIIMTGTIQDAVDFIKTSPMSTIGSAPMEGVVGRPMVELKDRCGKRIIVKVKVKDFV